MAKRPIALRINPEHVAQIDFYAAAHGLSRTEYMTLASLGELPSEISRDQRLDELADRMARLEQLAYNG